MGNNSDHRNVLPDQGRIERSFLILGPLGKVKLFNKSLLFRAFELPWPKEPTKEKLCIG